MLIPTDPLCNSVAIYLCQTTALIPKDYIPQQTKTAVDPHVGVLALFAPHTASVTPPQDDGITKGNVNFAIKARVELVYLFCRAAAKSRHYEVLPQKCGVCDAYL